MISDRHLKRICLIWLAMLTGTMLALLTGCCSTTDPARIVSRTCPAKRIYDDEMMKAYRERCHFDGKNYLMTSNCKWNADSLALFCKHSGIPYEHKAVDAKYDGKTIQRGHQCIVVGGTMIEYIDGHGVVRIKQ